MVLTSEKTNRRKYTESTKKQNNLAIGKKNMQNTQLNQNWQVLGHL